MLRDGHSNILGWLNYAQRERREKGKGKERKELKRKKAQRRIF